VADHSGLADTKQLFGPESLFVKFNGALGVLAN
jgi:hypothetical protein